MRIYNTALQNPISNRIAATNVETKTQMAPTGAQHTIAKDRNEKNVCYILPESGVR